MEEPLIFDDFYVNFFMTFVDSNSMPVKLDPRIGEFKIAQQIMDIDPTGGAPKLASIDVPVEEVDLATD